MAGSSARSQLSRTNDASSTRRHGRDPTGRRIPASAYDGTAMKNQLRGMSSGTWPNHFGPSASV